MRLKFSSVLIAFGLSVVSTSFASGPIAGPLTTYRSLQECQAAAAAEKAEGNQLDAEASKLIEALESSHSLITKRNEAWARASQIGEVCRRMKQAAAITRPLPPDASLEDRASKMSELHDLLTEGTLSAAVPNQTVRGIQEKNISIVRTEMTDLVGIIDGSADQIAKPIPPNTAGSSPSLVPLRGTPHSAAGEALLGPEAAAALDPDLAFWKVQEADREERAKTLPQAISPAMRHPARPTGCRAVVIGASVWQDHYTPPRARG